MSALNLVGAFDVAGQLVDSRGRLPHRNRERRARVAEDMLEPERRGADLVKPFRGRDAWNHTDRLLERKRGLFRLFDSGRVFG
jgi:hypothetical protein